MILLKIAALLIGAFACFIKWPWNMATGRGCSSDNRRDFFHLGLDTEEFKEAWVRLRLNSNYRGFFHNVTNLWIEWLGGLRPLSFKMVAFIIFAWIIREIIL
jgi:hypothetical protein